MTELRDGACFQEEGEAEEMRMVSWVVKGGIQLALIGYCGKVREVPHGGN